MNLTYPQPHITIELSSREITVRDFSGKESPQRLAALARARVPGERLRLTSTGSDTYGPAVSRTYYRIDN